MKKLEIQNLQNKYLNYIDKRTANNTLNMSDVVKFILSAYDTGYETALIEVIKDAQIDDEEEKKESPEVA